MTRPNNNSIMIKVTRKKTLTHLIGIEKRTRTNYYSVRSKPLDPTRPLMNKTNL